MSFVGSPDEAPSVPGNKHEAWPQPGARAILCNLAKAPKFNGQPVEVVSWNADKERWKCLLPNGGDVNVFATNLEPAEMPEEKVAAVTAMLEEGRLFDAWTATRGRSKMPAALEAALKERLSPGACHEIVQGRLELVPIDGKGLGYKAARDLQAGDVLVFDVALAQGFLSLQESYQGPSVGSNVHQVYFEMLRDMRHALGEPFVKEHVMTLRRATYCEDKNVAMQILDNNTVECCREPGRIALFLATARFNHSCCPNAFVDATRNECVVRALCDIPRGEEVCISYVPVSEPLQKRQEKLKNYGFECACPRCKQETESDPHLCVPCSCNKSTFVMKGNVRLYQTCSVCFSSFDREESEHQLSKIAEANKLINQSSSDPEEYLKKLMALKDKTIPGARNGIPPTHTETVLLLNNIAGLNLHIAAKLKRDAPEEHLKAFHKFKRKAIELFEKKHGTQTAQRDVDYFQMLQAAIVAPAKCTTSAEAQQWYAQKLSEACVLCFGQPELPDSLKCPA